MPELSREFLGLDHHLLGPTREDLDAQRDVVAVLLEKADDPLDVRLKIALFLPRQEGGVGRDPAGEAALQGLFDLDEIGRVDEDFHELLRTRSNRFIR